MSHVVEAVGDERLLTTSDYSHGDAKYPHTTKTFLQLPLSEESKRRILWDNPARLYKLQPVDAEETPKSPRPVLPCHEQGLG